MTIRLICQRSLTIAIFSCATNAFSSTTPISTQELHGTTSPECRINDSDPFEIGARAKSGQNYGQCYQFDHRPVTILTEAEAQSLGLPPQIGSVLVANLSHSVEGKEDFFIASIPIDHATSANLVLSFFLPTPRPPLFLDPGHAMLRVFFSQDVAIYQQNLQSQQLVHTVRELVLSMDSNIRFQFNPLLLARVADGSLALVSTIFTFDAKFRGNGENHKKPAEQWQLKMTAEQVSELVSRYIQGAETTAASQTYSLNKANCATEMLKIFDDMFKYSEDQLAKIAKIKNREWIPAQFPSALNARGLLDPVADRLPDVNTTQE
jgi:hypothetical protein